MKNNSLHHESARLHVTGSAKYVFDNFEQGITLFGKVVYSTISKGSILKLDIDEATKFKGVHAIVTAKDIKGHNQLGPVFKDEPCLIDRGVEAIGQAIALIAAENEEIANNAAKLISVEYSESQPILTLEQAYKNDSKLKPPRYIKRGNPQDAFAKSEYIIEGKMKSGAQEHWYLEPQAAMVIPGENNEFKVFASSQNPTETQIIVAEVLGLDFNKVICEVKRIGGAFGGKETQANHIAAWTALLAQKTGKPVAMQLFRDDDQKITGRRHPFSSTYKIGFDKEGIINVYKVDLNADSGHAADLSMAILERAMLHAENSYFIPNIEIKATAWQTNHFSNTAFRGFGGPQGMAVIEHAIDRIARFLKIDPSLVRYRNFYKENTQNITPYGQLVENIRLQTLYNSLIEKSEYHKRKVEIDDFNRKSEFIKKGIALTPVKFGISFTTAFLNQAGALINVFKDGSVQVNHGGTEMGQGLNTKIIQIVIAEFGIPADKIIINPTDTSRVPNTSATAASSGSDLNGMAVKNAIDVLKLRLMPLIRKLFEEKYSSNEIEEVEYSENRIVYTKDRNKYIDFPDVIAKAYLQQISLSTTGFYKTPEIFFDREHGVGRPFHYFAYGMAVSQVTVDILTGDHEIDRVDIIHDVGNSLNENIDIGQVRGGFIQGVGWVTTEEIKWDLKGNLLTHSPDTYKIPTIADIPKTFNVELLCDAPNENTIRRSKAVGEPPFMLAFSVWMALRYAIASISGHNIDPELDIPATNERIVYGAVRQKLFVGNSQ